MVDITRELNAWTAKNVDTAEVRRYKRILEKTGNADEVVAVWDNHNYWGEVGPHEYEDRNAWGKPIANQLNKKGTKWAG